MAEAGDGATEMGLLRVQIQAKVGRGDGWTVDLRALQGPIAETGAIHAAVAKKERAQPNRRAIDRSAEGLSST